MIMQRSSSWLLSAESQRPTRFAASARSAARFRPSSVSGGSLAVLRIHDQRGSQVARERRLAPVQPELAEIVVHVGDRAGLRLRALALRRLLDRRRRPLRACRTLW